MILILIVAELFFGTLKAAVFMLPGIFWFAGKRKKAIEEKKAYKRRESFRECLIMLKSALSAGYSPENAWRNAYKELKHLMGEDEFTVKAMRKLCSKLDMNENIESALDEFSTIMAIEEASDFCEVFRFAKRSGGDFSKLIGSAVDRLSQKIETEREIRSITAAKRLEQLIMNVIPLGICAYLRIGSPGYMDALYGNISGILIMSGCLAVYVGAFELSERIASIEV